MSQIDKDEVLLENWWANNLNTLFRSFDIKKEIRSLVEVLNANKDKVNDRKRFYLKWVIKNQRSYKSKNGSQRCKFRWNQFTNYNTVADEFT